jgi:hypothetical protein
VHHQNDCRGEGRARAPFRLAAQRPTAEEES